MSCKKIKAAVSIIIVKPNAPNDAQVLLIERSKNKNDPWSGHMAFPGGRYQDNDQDILSTAIRETLEEIGLDLRKESSFFESNKKNHIPRLSDVKTLKIHEKNIVVTPFLFGLKKKPEIVINKEVQQVVWIPLKFSWSLKIASIVILKLMEKYSRYHVIFIMIKLFGASHYQ